MKESGALKATMDRAYEHANLAKDALAPLAARNGAAYSWKSRTIA